MWYESYSADTNDAMAEIYEELLEVMREMNQKERVDNMMDKKTLNAMNKKSGEELQGFLAFKKRGGSPAPKKGKGSYKRNKKVDYEGQKH